MKTSTFFSVLALAGCSPAAAPAPQPIVIPANPTANATTPSATASANDLEPTVPRASGGEPFLAADVLKSWSPTTTCRDFDYYPHGGIRNFWCHHPKRITLAAVRAAAGVDVFLSGPHKGDDLALGDSDFGHYNPAFVKWLVEKVAPNGRDSAGREATQSAYDEKLEPLAEVFWHTLQKAKADPQCFEKEKKAYADFIAKKTVAAGYYERWFYFMNPYFCSRPWRANDSFFFDNGFDAGVSGNVTKTVVGFWLRRSIDGTMDTFADGLKKLVTAYDPRLAESSYTAADPYALTRAIDEGLRVARQCKKDPRSPLPTAYVNIHVAPDGSLSASMATVAVRGSAIVPCIEAAFASQHVTPFSGAPLKFNRSVAMK